MMEETITKVIAGFVLVFFFIGIIAVLWEVAKYMAGRGLEEYEEYEEDEEYED